MAPSAPASSSISLKFSGPLSPRPPETITSDSVRSTLLPLAAAVRSRRIRFGAGSLTAAIATAPAAPALDTGANTLGRSEAMAGVFGNATFWIAFPAYTGRVATSLPPSTASAVQSEASPTPSRAATRGARSFPSDEAGNRISAGSSSSAAATTARV